MSEPRRPAGNGAPKGANLGAASRWVWVLGTVVVVVAVMIALFVRGQRPAQDAEAASVPPGETVGPSTSEQVDPTPSTAPSPSEPASSEEPTAGPSSAPMPEPDSRFDGQSAFVSDTPQSDMTLQDGGFFALVRGADATGRTISVDIAIFYGGQAAIDYVTEHDPARAAEGPPDNGYVIVNDVERIRVVPVSPDARVRTWCYPESGEQTTKDWDFAAWSAAPDLAATTSCAEPGRQANDTYWIDVRDGMVRQVTGQYLP